jgi:hypothetical protein
MQRVQQDRDAGAGARLFHTSPGGVDRRIGLGTGIMVMGDVDLFSFCAEK